MLLKITLIALFGFATATLATTSTEDKLMTTLMKEYHKGVLAGTTDLKLSLTYMCAEVNKFDFMLTSRLMEKYTWTDTRLKWTPSEFNNINKIRFPAHMIWTPDMKIYNSHKEEETRDEVNVIIYNDGKVLWVPTVTYKTNCLPGGRNTFICKQKLGSWSYDDKFIKLTMEGKGFDMSSYLETCPQTMTDIKVKVEGHTYPCCPDEKYSSMDIEFTVHDRI